MAPSTPAPLYPGSDPLGTAHQEVEVTTPLMEVKEKLGFPVDKPLPMNPKMIHEVDELQDELMAEASPEGRPPNHDLRIAEWRWLALAIAVVIGGALTWAIIAGVSGTWIVLASLLLICFLGIGIGPVLYAGLLRGGEEHKARKVATAVVKDEAQLTR